MIPQQIPVKNHYGNNSATVFDFDFYIENETQITVTHTDLNGIQTVLEYGVDYILNSNSLKNQNGGSIIFPIDGSKFKTLAWDRSTDKKELLSIALTLKISQEAEYTTSGDLDKSNLEYSFDYLTRLIQILARKMERAVLVNEGEGTTPAELLTSIKTSEINSRNSSIESNDFATSARNSADEILNNDDFKKVSNVLNSENNYIEHVSQNLEMIENATEYINIIDEKMNTTNSYMQQAKTSVIQAQDCVTQTQNNVVQAQNKVVEATEQANLARQYAQTTFGKTYVNHIELAVSNMYETGNVLTDTKGFEQLKQMKRSTFDLNKFEVVGTPSLTDDGVASGFSVSNYLKSILVDFTKPFKIKFRSNLTDTTTVNQGTILALTGYSDYNNVIKTYTTPAGNSRYLVGFTKNGTAHNTQTIFDINKYYDFIFVWTGQTYYLYTKEMNESIFIKCLEFNDNTPITFSNVVTNQDVLAIGTRIYQQHFLGQIDLKHFSIIVDGVEVFNGNKTGVDQITETLEIPYTLSKTGSKIVDAIYRDRVHDMYEQFGQANYYTLLDGEKYNVSVVGNPTLENGVASGFSITNYLIANGTSQIDFAKPFEYYTTAQFKGTVQHLLLVTGSTNSIGFRTTSLSNNNYKMELWLDNAKVGDLTNYVLQQNVTYDYKFTFDGNQTYKCYYKLQNESNYMEGLTVTSTKKIIPTGDLHIFGVTNVDAIIDLSKTKFISDGKEVFRAYEKDNFTLPKGEIYGMKADKSELDGQWVKKNITVADSVAFKGYGETYSLSDYLPNDNNIYEVYGYGIVTTGNVSGNSSSLLVESPICDTFGVCRAITRTANTANASGMFIIPVDSSRQIKMASTSTTGTYQIFLRGYRRIK